MIVSYEPGPTRESETAMPVAAPTVDAVTDVRDRSATPSGRGPWRRSKLRAYCQQRTADLLRRVLDGTYRDPLFERPDLIEDDYYRFLNQPRG